MGTQQIRHLRDVSHGPTPSRLRLLAPLRYLSIRSAEKTKYDFFIPLAVGIVGWGIYSLIDPKPAIFGDDGLLRFARDLLIMAVPFLVGSLAVVAMGPPGTNMDQRPLGTNLYLDGRSLTLRQFVCYLLGYLSFLGLVTLGSVVVAGLLRADVLHWIGNDERTLRTVWLVGTLGLSLLLSALTVTVFWALYFLTDVVNRVD